jgi:hypothetical protein
MLSPVREDRPAISDIIQVCVQNMKQDFGNYVDAYEHDLAEYHARSKYLHEQLAILKETKLSLDQRANRIRYERRLPPAFEGPGSKERHSPDDSASSGADS